MHDSMERLPVLMQVPGATIRSVNWGGMTVAFAQYAAGTDLSPALQGLKDDRCQCPHWGVVLKGTLHLRFADGREEVIKAGEVWYAEPGHTAWCDEDTELLDVSPQEQFEEVVAHVRRQIEG